MMLAMHGATLEPRYSTWKLDMAGLRSRLGSGDLFSTAGVDLSGVRFVTPGGMADLACLLEKCVGEHGTIDLILPQGEVASYMQRMDFFASFEGRIACDRDLTGLEDRSRYDTPLSELSRIENDEDLSKVTARFHRLLSGGGLSKVEVNRCCKMLSESLDNVAQHAQSRCGAYTLIQAYSVGSRKLHLAIADAGVGIPDTLRDHSEALRRGARTDAALIELAALEGVSRFGPERVVGLTDAIRSVGNGQGTLTAWSGEGWVKFHGASNTTCTRRVHRLEGTCLEAVFPTS